MRIEQLKASPDRAGRYWVTFSDGTKLGLYRQSVEDFSLYAGKELTAEEWSALQEHAGQMSAKMRAVRIVSASSVSKCDLQERLVRKGEDPVHSEEAVAWMEELHLIDDRETACQVVRSCIGKGYGIQRAKQALYEKRIPKQYWDEALEDYPDQLDKIVEFLRGKLDKDATDKDIQRAIAALMRRGHNYSAIRQGLQMIQFDSDDFPED